MDIAVIGTGYVGLVAGACFADTGHRVICVDIDIEKINMLRNGVIPIYEPGLEELVKRGIKSGRLSFSLSIKDSVKKSDVIFIAVGTPSKDDGSADLDVVFDVTREIGRSMNGSKIIVIKSTVPVGTSEKVREILSSETGYEFHVVSNPEFLKEGAALEDFLKPDRVVIGLEHQKDNAKVRETMRSLYAPFIRSGNPILFMDTRSAELVKYASNAFLSTRISFINEIVNLCERFSANVENVRVGIGTDSRIGMKFLFPGVGYGGSCFPKDIRALIKMGNAVGYEMRILKAVEEVNRDQKELLARKIIKHFGGDINGKDFAVWGLSFKPNTDDMREAPSITIINRLLKKGGRITAYDPVAMKEAKRIFGDRIAYSDDQYDTLNGKDALVIITEWNEFRTPDFNRIARLLKNRIIFDGRNIFDPHLVESYGFEYIYIGGGGKRNQ